jgi:hypothetical protein
VLANRPVNVVAAYFSPTRPFIESDLTKFLSGGFPVLMTGDLDAKHPDWNSRMTIARSSLLSDYAKRNSCLIDGTDFPTTVPYKPNVTLDVLHIVVVRDFVLSLHMTLLCS